MNRLPAIFLTLLALGFALLNAYKLMATPPKDVVELTVWETFNPEEHRIFKQIAAEFEQQYFQKYGKQVKLKLERVPFDGLMPRIKYACLAGAAPDICRVDNAWVLTLAYGRAITALDTLPNFNSTIEEVEKEYVAAAIDSNIIELVDENGQMKRHLYGLPDQTNCVALFWNKDLFKQSEEELRSAGLDPERAPATWEEFERYARVLTIPEKKQYGFAMFNSLWWSLPFFNTFGAEFVRTSADGHVYGALDEEAGQKALEFMTRLYQSGVEAGAWRTGSINPDQGFLNGKYAMILSGPWNLKRFSMVNFGVSLIPAGPAGTSSNVGGQNMVVFRSSKHPEIALEFLRYFSSEEVQVKWCETLGQIPVNLKAFEKVSTANPHLKVFMEQMKTAKPRPKIPRMDVLEEKVINPAIQLAMQGDLSADEALRRAVDELNKNYLPLIYQTQH
ncbi:MAG: extracellular solute-binding protein [Acidobacteriota bacterium]|nr:extracellular solute-binding protein [Blastocatellia bacterium]MDW8411537.1 extracellular solute-binding protein [Acidobacteriota bacterium]